MGNIFSKERAIITLTSTGASLTTGSAGDAATTLDARSGGNAAQDLQARLELVCQWATITGIVKGTVAAELYLLPALDGTNYPDVDVTSGASAIPYESFVGQFTCIKAPTANTNMRFVSGVIDLHPVLYKAYILNKSGQTIAVNWSLKVVPAQAQYT